MQLNFNDSTFLRWIILLSITGLIFSGTYFALGLYADGSSYTYQILTSKQFFAWDNARAFAQFINQTPIVLLIKYGVTDLNYLIRTYSFGLVAIPLGFWLAAMMEQMHTDLFWGLVIAFVLTYLNCGFLAIGEFNLVYAMTAYAAAILLSRKDLGIIRGLVLVLISISLTRCYETMACLGPLLFAICLIRFQKCSILLEKAVLLISAFFFAASFGVSIMYILYPRDGGNLHSAKHIGWLIHSFHFFYISAMPLLFLATCFLKQKWIKMLALILSLLLSFWYLGHPDFWNTPQRYGGYRAFSGLLLFFAIGAMALIFFYRKEKSLVNVVYAPLIPLFLFISLLIPFFLQSFGFFKWLGIYEQEVLANHGVVLTVNSKILQNNNIYDTLWTNPSLSVVLRGDQKGAIFVSPGKGWAPFDPHQVPDDILKSYKKNSLLV